MHPLCNDVILVIFCVQLPPTLQLQLSSASTIQTHSVFRFPMLCRVSLFFLQYCCWHRNFQLFPDGFHFLNWDFSHFLVRWGVFLSIVWHVSRQPIFVLLAFSLHRHVRPTCQAIHLGEECCQCFLSLTKLMCESGSLALLVLFEFWKRRSVHSVVLEKVVLSRLCFVLWNGNEKARK